MTDSEKRLSPRLSSAPWRAWLCTAIAAGAGNISVASTILLLLMPGSLRLRASHFARDIVPLAAVAMPFALTALMSALFMSPKWPDLVALGCALLLGFGMLLVPFSLRGFPLSAIMLAVATIAAVLPGAPSDPGIPAIVAFGGSALVAGLSQPFLAHAGRRALRVLGIGAIVAAVALLLAPRHSVRSIWERGFLWPIPVMVEFGLVGCAFAKISGRANRNHVAVACASGFMLFCISVVGVLMLPCIGLVYGFDPKALAIGVGPLSRAVLLRLFAVFITLGLPFSLTTAITTRMLLQATRQ